MKLNHIITVSFLLLFFISFRIPFNFAALTQRYQFAINTHIKHNFGYFMPNRSEFDRLIGKYQISGIWWNIKELLNILESSGERIDGTTWNYHCKLSLILRKQMAAIKYFISEIYPVHRIFSIMGNCMRSVYRHVDALYPHLFSILLAIFTNCIYLLIR